MSDLVTNEDPRRRRIQNLARLFGAVTGAGVGAVCVMLTLDLLSSPTPGAWEALTSGAKTQGLVGSLGSLAEVMAAVLGLSLTVVAIVVQLASQRYPSKVVDLFMTDRVNMTVFGFMASSCIYMVLAPVFAVSATGPPLWTMATAVVLTIVNFGLLLPYFGHVFAFLDPHSIITRIRKRAARGFDRENDTSLRHRQVKLANGIDRIADNSMAAIGQYDRNLAVHTVRALEELVCDYLSSKTALPEGWEIVDSQFLNTLSQEFLAEILENRTWVEAKTLIEYERLFRQALGHMGELVSQLAVSTRAIGEHALERGEDEVVELTVRFFNTYIRHALNARNVRAVYNVLYEYRLYAAGMLARRPDMGTKVVRYMVYYGRTANTMGLPFATVTAAHDVRELCQVAYEHPEVDMRSMLRWFLSLDQRSEEHDSDSEVALLGVRRAQSILGAFFLSRGDEEFVEQIRYDMRDEPRARLVVTRDAILGVEERKFWEITDRGFNFDYVEPELREHIVAFFDPMLGFPGGVPSKAAPSKDAPTKDASQK